MKILAGQPKPFYLIFFLEMWERFGYYGVQVLLVLYMVRRLKFADTRADILFAAFSALVYLLPCVGGYIGDHILGTKRTILLGAFVLALGYLLLSIPGISAHHFTLPLAVIALGVGLFKANPSSLLSKVYKETGHNVDSGFTLYYMAINVGALISMNLTPILSRFFGWHVAYSICFIGLVVAIVNFIWMRSSIAHTGSYPDKQPMRKDYLLYVLVLGALAVVGGNWLLLHNEIMSTLLAIGTVVLLTVYVRLTLRAKDHERKGMWLFLILFFQAIVFFILYFQMPMSLTLFAFRNVDHSILGIPIQPAQFQMLNSFWIILLGPILAIFYHKLSSRGKDVSLPTKFAFGALLTAFSFLVLPLGGLFNHHGMVSGMWLVFSYGLQSAGELLVSALGLSLAARYVPQRFMGFTMGLWFLCTSIASIVAGRVASLASIPKNISMNPVLSLPIYNHLFLEIGLVATGVSGLMFLLVPTLKKLADHKKPIADNDYVDAGASVKAVPDYEEPIAE